MLRKCTWIWKCNRRRARSSRVDNSSRLDRPTLRRDNQNDGRFQKQFISEDLNVLRKQRTLAGRCQYAREEEEGDEYVSGGAQGAWTQVTLEWDRSQGSYRTN